RALKEVWIRWAKHPRSCPQPTPSPYRSAIDPSFCENACSTGLPALDPPRYSRAVSSKRTWTRSELPTALERALGAAIERGARAPVILRLTEIAGYTDWVLLVSARSERQVRGVVDGVIESIATSSEAATSRLIGTDGLDHYLWALLDYD